jgi:hypothetical protein
VDIGHTSSLAHVNISSISTLAHIPICQDRLVPKSKVKYMLDWILRSCNMAGILHSSTLSRSAGKLQNGHRLQCRAHLLTMTTILGFFDEKAGSSDCPPSCPLLHLPSRSDRAKSLSSPKKPWLFRTLVSVLPFIYISRLIVQIDELGLSSIVVPISVSWTLISIGSGSASGLDAFLYRWCDRYSEILQPPSC